MAATLIRDNANLTKQLCLFVCLFVCLRSTSRSWYFCEQNDEVLKSLVLNIFNSVTLCP